MAAAKVVKQIHQNPYEKLESKRNGESGAAPGSQRPPENKPKLPFRTEFTIFNRSADFETRVRPNEINQLLQEIRQEVKSVARSSDAIASQIKGVEKLTLDNFTSKPGVYHARFLEFILKYLRDVRKKVAEAGTWIEAMQSKKAKRGSLFTKRAKKQGTAYSMSQEHSVARSTQ